MWKRKILLCLALLVLFAPFSYSQEVSGSVTPFVESPPTSSSASLSGSLSAIELLLSQLEANSDLSEAESLALVETLKQARFDLEQASSKLLKSEATASRIESLLLESERTLEKYQVRSRILGYSVAIEGLVILTFIVAGLLW